jgi:hypothetical protein
MIASKKEMIESLEILMAPHIKIQNYLLKWKNKMSPATALTKDVIDQLPSTIKLTASEEAIRVYSNAINHIKNQ